MLCLLSFMVEVGIIFDLNFNFLKVGIAFNLNFKSLEVGIAFKLNFNFSFGSATITCNALFARLTGGSAVRGGRVGSRRG